jgi:two-component system invasion response regulator UvrY
VRISPTFVLTDDEGREVGRIVALLDELKLSEDTIFVFSSDNGATMPGMGGIEAIERILAKDSSAKILVLSAHEDSVHPKRVLNAGAMGYLTKRSAAEELIKAIRTIATGKKYIEASVAQQMAIQQLSGDQSPVDVLSEREFEVFMSLARGKTTNEIAESLFLSPRTVGTHLYNIKQKLNANNSAEIALIAMRSGLLEP